MSNSAINTQVAQLKIGNVQNQADNSAVYSGGIWSLKNSTALTSVTITDSGNVGIGTASPSTVLDLRRGAGIGVAVTLSANGNAPSSGNFELSQAGDNSCYVWNRSNNIIAFGTNNTERMRIDASGAVTAGVGSPLVSHTLQSGNPAGGAAAHIRKPNVAVNSSGNSYIEFYGASGGYDGYLGVSGTTLQVVDASDSRKKENVRPANYGLKEIKALNPVIYDWKEEFGGEKDVKGFLAQEVKQVLPECVTIQDESDRGGFSDSQFLGTAAMIPVLVKAIQELSAKVDAQAEEIKALKAQP